MTNLVDTSGKCSVKYAAGETVPKRTPDGEGSVSLFNPPFDMARTGRYELLLPPDLQADLEDYCAKVGESAATVVRVALRRFLRGEKDGLSDAVAAVSRALEAERRKESQSV